MTDSEKMAAQAAEYAARTAGFEAGLKVVKGIRAADGAAEFYLSEEDWVEALAGARKAGAEAMREAAALRVVEYFVSVDDDTSEEDGTTLAVAIRALPVLP
jgi:hypothetical protein